MISGDIDRGKLIKIKSSFSSKYNNINITQAVHDYLGIALHHDVKRLRPQPWAWIIDDVNLNWNLVHLLSIFYEKMNHSRFYLEETRVPHRH